MPRSAAAMIARSRQPRYPTIARPRTAAIGPAPSRHDIWQPDTVPGSSRDWCNRVRDLPSTLLHSAQRAGGGVQALSTGRPRQGVAASPSWLVIRIATSRSPRSERRRTLQRDGARRREPWLATALSRRCGTARHRHGERSGRTLTARADICRVGKVPLHHQSA